MKSIGYIILLTVSILSYSCNKNDNDIHPLTQVNIISPKPHDIITPNVPFIAKIETDATGIDARAEYYIDDELLKVMSYPFGDTLTTLFSGGETYFKVILKDGYGNKLEDSIQVKVTYEKIITAGPDAIVITENNQERKYTMQATIPPEGSTGRWIHLSNNDGCNISQTTNAYSATLTCTKTITEPTESIWAWQIDYGTSSISDTVFIRFAGKSEILNKTYTTIKIGTQVWMEENLNIATSDAVQDKTNQFYYYPLNEKTLAEISDLNYRVPTKQDYQVLVNYLNGEEDAADRLKKQNSNWTESFTSDETSGFDAIAFGQYIKDATQPIDIGKEASFWTVDKENQEYVAIEISNQTRFKSKSNTRLLPLRLIKK